MSMNITAGMMTSDQTEHWAYRDAMEQSWWWVTWLPKAQVCDRNQAITAMTLCEIAAQMRASGGHHLDHPQWPLFCDLAGELGMAGLDALGMVDKPLEPGQTSPEPATETRTTYVIQMFSELYNRGWVDDEGQLTDGYPTLAAARDAFPKIRDWDAYRGVHGEVKVRIVERTVTETAYEIEEGA